MMVNVHEYIVVYQKGGASAFRFIGEQRDEEADGFKIQTMTPADHGVNQI